MLLKLNKYYLRIKNIWVWTKVGLQLYVKLLFLYYLLISVLFTIQTTINLLLPTCVCVFHSGTLRNLYVSHRKTLIKKIFKFTKKPAYLGGRVDMPIN